MYVLIESSIFNFIKCFTVVIKYKSTNKIMKVLNVAEKNDAAKSIAGYLARGNCRKREGFSVYNKIYEFNINLWNQECQMIMTSVSGHLMNHEFTGSYRKWQGCHPISLFSAPVIKTCQDENQNKIKKTLEREIRSCGALIIWTDCDREGENIGFEIINVCQNVKPNIKVYRAKFSEITQLSVNRALQNLGPPNKAISDAVDVRSELDLRIGAAFTRFQTLRLQQVFPSTLADMLISYGSCQFPTLGFVVERFLAIERFHSEPYWKLIVVDVRERLSVEFRWERIRLFEETPCQIFLDMCQEQSIATVLKVVTKPKSKWRPLPLDTIELEKQSSRKLHLNAKETMRIAEKLYTLGFISYPRTETNIFPKELNLVPLVNQHINNPMWGHFAQQLLENGLSPRQGRKSDQAHPPIHPLKYADNLQGNEAKVYEFIVRHFLACLSRNAEGLETVVNIDIAGEKFIANGLHIVAKNYLEVYIYEKWSDKEIHQYQEGQTFVPTRIDMVQEETSPPSLLTEADLITLMDKHGIGTDATHAEHIDTIKSRQYVGLRDDRHLMPSKLGIGLVMAYDKMGYAMSKPDLRADLEKDLKLICEGEKDPKEVLHRQIATYRNVFEVALERANLIDSSLAEYLNEQPERVEELSVVQPQQENVILKCPKCNLDMVLKNRKQGTGKYIGCMGFPGCNNVIWLPQEVEDVIVLEDVCDKCPESIHKLKFKLARNMFAYYSSVYVTCIGGCDPNFNNALNINIDNIRRSSQSNESGYNSMENRVTQNSNRSRTETNVVESASNSRAANQSNISINRQPNRGNALIGFNNNSNFNTGNQSTNCDANNRKKNDTSDKKRGNTNNNRMQFNNNDALNTNNTMVWGNLTKNSIIMCQCHEQAIELTVRKGGPNQGRQFYKCAKPQGTGCDFFLWATDKVEQQSNSNSTSNESMPSTSNVFGWGDSSTSSSDRVMCICKQPAIQLTVRKEGPNKGRQFYKCPKRTENTCNFFQWADNARDENTINYGASSSTYNNRQDGNTPRKPYLPTCKRKCSVCGEEGHTKRTCPGRANY